MTTIVASADSSRKPRFGWRTVGAIAATTLGSGPLLVMGIILFMSLVYPESFIRLVVRDPAGFAVMLAEFVVYGSVVSLPATLVHAAAVGLLARRARDGFGWSLASGTVLGVLLASALIWFLFLSGEVGGFDLLESKLVYVAGIGVPFGATGALTGLLYWRIAIRPRRRWRLLRQHSEEAIRAME